MSSDGRMRRDFTHIDDIAAGVAAAHDRPPADDRAAKPGGSVASHAIYNIGDDRPEEPGRLIDVIEAACGRPAIRDLQPMQPGDVPATDADIAATTRDPGVVSAVSIDTGVDRSVRGYRDYAGA